MNTLTNNGIRISVQTQYLPNHSNPMESKYIFGYHIVIENGSMHTVQLMRRFWRIKDADGRCRQIDGEGVVGLQPVLEPGEAHSYSSFCNLYTEIGRMSGAFLMCRMSDESLFDAVVPEFVMVVPDKLN
jgi:ApaG protein